MKRRNLILLILLVAISTSLIVGCSNKTNLTDNNNANNNGSTDEKQTDEYGIHIDEDSVTFTDGRDKEVTIKKAPKRVIVLFDSYLEVWCKSGGTVVGRLEAPPEKMVEEAKDAEVVGKQGAISLEKMLSLEPDLVILNSNQKSQMELVQSLEDNEIQMIALNYFVKDDYFKLVRLFTALNDREDLYEEHAVKVKEDIESIVEKAPTDKEYKVLLMMASAKSITVRGSDSTVGEMLEDLNTINISDAISDTLDSKAFSMEKVIEEDPDFIFVQTTGSDKEKVLERLKKDVEDNPAWSSLTAVKEDRYIFLPKDLYMYKPNHRYAEAYEGLAKILYPDVFK